MTADIEDPTLSQSVSNEATGQSARQGSMLNPHMVYFKRGDPENPYNWSLPWKWSIVTIMCFHTFWVAGLGSIYIPAVSSIAQEFGTSNLVARLPTATYLFGFSIGPVVWSPVAEDFGRKKVFIACLGLLYIFQIPGALATNIETLIVTRFIAGFFGSAVFNAVGLIPDLFLADDPQGGWALNFWALSAEMIVIGPIFGAYIVQNLGWRWIFWVSMIVGFGLTLILILVIPETRGGILLQRRARKLRKETGDQDYFAEHEVLGQRPIGQMIKETLWRPVLMLFTEPIVAWFAIYDGLNYAIIYLAIEAVPIVYAQHGIEEPIVEYVFFAIVVGYLIAIALYPVQLMAANRMERKSGKVPESKLLWGFLISVLFPVSLYMFAWTGIPQVHWFVSMIALALFGISSHILFLMVSDFTVESYGHLASSAVTGQSFLREALSGGILIVGENFYTDVRPAIATTILAAIATLLGVLPFVFFRWGPTIRARSSFSLEIKQAAAEDKRREDEELLAEKAQKEQA